MSKLRYFFTSETKALEDERALIVRITTPTKDRAGDVVDPTGVKLDNYRKNPVVLFGHNYDDLPIARAEELSVDEEGITAKVVFPARGTYEKADVVYALWKQGVGSAWSIGFIPDMDTAEELEGGGFKIKDWEMLEFSAVPIPANPDALTVMRSKGFSDEVIDEVTEGKADNEESEDEEETSDEVRSVEAVEVEDTSEGKEMRFTTADGTTVTYRMSADTYQTFFLSPEDEPEAKDDESDQLLKTLTNMRDHLRASDKAVGLALRTMNQLLDETHDDGR